MFVQLRSLPLLMFLNIFSNISFDQNKTMRISINNKRTQSISFAITHHLLFFYIRIRTLAICMLLITTERMRLSNDVEIDFNALD